MFVDDVQVMEDPHKDKKLIRPKTPAAFIFDRPSTAAERLAQSGGWQSTVGLTAAPIFASAGVVPGQEGDSAGAPAQGEGAEQGEADAEASAGNHQTVNGSSAASTDGAAPGGELVPGSAEWVTKYRGLSDLTADAGSLQVLIKMFGQDTLLQVRSPLQSSRSQLQTFPRPPSQFVVCFPLYMIILTRWVGARDDQMRGEESSEREAALEAMQNALWSNGPLIGSGDTTLKQVCVSPLCVCPLCVCPLCVSPRVLLTTLSQHC
eukprot:COSAG05_NODE_2830_length_2592_cov_47.594063_2_plen_263_part_00